MTDRLQPDQEWRAQEEYLRMRDHAKASEHDTARCGRYLERTFEANDKWQALIKERESK